MLFVGKWVLASLNCYSGKSGHFCLISSLSIKYDVSCRFFKDILLSVSGSSIPSLLRFLL